MANLEMFYLLPEKFKDLTLDGLNYGLDFRAAMQASVSAMALFAPKQFAEFKSTMDARNEH
jgi:hypothetical protein